MSNPSKRKGTAWESAIVTYLRTWWPFTERRALSGAADQGDIAGIVGVCIEAKASTRWEIPAWLRELDVEIANSQADVGALWCKSINKAQVEDGFIVMRPAQFVALLKQAGY